MKFKTDENLPAEAATVLREAGYDAEAVWDEALTGADDTTIAGRIRTEDRVLITLDLDFANIRSYPPEDYPGIIVLRLDRQDKANTLAVIRRFAIPEMAPCRIPYCLLAG
ncbi:MAG: DUF5615 family PIN-like protein [Bryobacterales bacterium]|nr:DUF5615 family PIN-like protein [Bryobacterales bacterium]